jgi:hypothetical protein
MHHLLLHIHIHIHIRIHPHSSNTVQVVTQPFHAAGNYLLARCDLYDLMYAEYPVLGPTLAGCKVQEQGKVQEDGKKRRGEKTGK